MNHNKNKALREGSMMVALTVVLILASVYVPFFSLIGYFACGIPMAALSARNGFKVTIPALIAILAVTFLITGNILSAVSVVLMWVFPGGVAGYAMGKKYSFFTTLFATCLAVCLGWIFELFVFNAFLGRGVEEMINEAITQMKETLSYLTGPLVEAGTIAEGVTAEQMINALIQTVEDVFRLYLPSMIVLSSMIEGYLVIRICGFIINRTKVASVNVVPFSRMKASGGMSTVAVLSGLIFMFAGTSSVFGSVLLNVMFILYAIIAICGLSLVDFKMQEKIKSPWARFGIYVAVFLFGGAFMTFILMGLIVAGILDSRRDFRRLGETGI